jgi:hypothetical protein
VIMAIRDFPPSTSTSAMRDAPRSESVATQIAAVILNEAVQDEHRHVAVDASL